MGTREDAEAIARIAERRRAENLSLAALLKRTRYAEMRGCVTEADVRRVLAEHPELVPEWEVYSDKRTSGGYAIGDDGGVWHVLMPFPGDGDQRRRTFGDRLDGFAAFVLAELDFWASVP